MSGVKGRVRLREKREAAWMTQAELCELSGITVANISRIENGQHQPRISTVRRLAKALGVEPDELVVRQ